jgi:hypothetical protein
MKILSFILPKSDLSKDLLETITETQRSVIQKRLYAIAAEFDAQKSLAQLQYLQSIDLSPETPKELLRDD